MGIFRVAKLTKLKGDCFIAIEEPVIFEILGSVARPSSA